MTKFMRVALFALGAMLSVAIPTAAMGQAFPSKPIRLVTPFPPGGSADVLARTVGDRLTEIWRQPVLVDSRPGGNTIIAATQVAQAPADGYTWFLTIDFTLSLTKALYSKLPFDPEKDFTPITLLATQPLLLISNPKVLPPKSLRELVGYAKANPGKLNVGVGAVVSQLVYEELKANTGLTAEVINFRGSQPTTTALVAGDVHFIVDAPLTNIPFLKEGRIHGLAVTSKERMAALPDVPTVHEAGMPYLEMSSWFGLVAPAGTPRAVVDKINRDVTTVLAMPEVRAKLGDFALTAASSTPEELQALIRAFADRWQPVVRRAGIRLD
jgi:tripartite-type tricarboxylate transporter receptor subunit TctC